MIISFDSGTITKLSLLAEGESSGNARKIGIIELEISRVKFTSSLKEYVPDISNFKITLESLSSQKIAEKSKVLTPHCARLESHSVSDSS